MEQQNNLSFTQKEIVQLVTHKATLFRAPDPGAEMVTEILFGETAEILEHTGEFYYVRCLRDGYEGYLHEQPVTTEHLAPTHHVSAVQTLIYKEPDYKCPPSVSLPMMSRLTLDEQSSNQNGFAPMIGGYWVWADHIEDITETRHDPVETALKFLGTPYLWGGRTSRGIDCSGLVQIAMQAAGISCPRDSGPQMEAGPLGRLLEFGDTIQYAALERGDIVFFEGHVGIMSDAEYLINATARTMDTRIEKLEDVIPHYKGGILAVRRP